MAWEVENFGRECVELVDAGIFEIEALISEALFESVVRIAPFEVTHAVGEAGELLFGEAENLADVAHGRAAAIGDDIGGHGCAERAIALIDVLDNAFALIAAGEIEIDVGHFAALLREKTFEEEFHADRVNGGDAEGVANGAIGSGAAALHENLLAAAEINEIPNDEEVAREFELFNHGEFALDLPLGFFVIGPIAPARALVCELAEIRHFGFAGRDGIAGELITEVVESELETGGELGGLGERFREVGEEALHFGAGFEVSFVVVVEKSAGFIESGFVMDASEHVLEVAAIFGGIGDAVGGE